MLVVTVANKHSNYTNANYSCAVLVRQLQNKIGRPNTKEFVQIVNSNQLPNCLITAADIQATKDIFRPNLGSLKGKTTCSKPHCVKEVIHSVPTAVFEKY